MKGLVLALVLVAACAPSGGQLSTATLATVPPTPTRAPQPTLAPTLPPVAAVAPITELRSDVARNAPGADPLHGVPELAAADAGFAFELYQTLVSGSDENLFFSPYSISTALSMLLAGARGNTAAELRAALGVIDDAAWHDARNRLELALANAEGRSQPYEGDAEPMTLEPTNAIFGQADYAFRDAFLDLLAADYGAGLQEVDFATAPDPARLGINEWVADATHERIPELLKQGSINELTRAVLVNAIYFKANWYKKFSPKLTTTDAFHRLDGSVIEVPTMHASPETRYAEGDGWAAVTLPYWGSASMIVLVPDDGSFADVESRLDAEFVAKVLQSMEGYKVHLSLPRWESETTTSLTDALRQLGIVDAFAPGAADLSGMADFAQTGELLYVQDVVHQANITVDEDGTEAAAATAVLVFAVCRCPPPEVTLTVDRPFIYLIRDDVTGEILFVGRVLEP